MHQLWWPPDTWVCGSVLCWVEKFKYLGSHFTGTTELDTVLSYPISLAAAVFGGCGALSSA